MNSHSLYSDEIIGDYILPYTLILEFTPEDPETAFIVEFHPHRFHYTTERYIAFANSLISFYEENTGQPFPLEPPTNYRRTN